MKKLSRKAFLEVLSSVHFQPFESAPALIEKAIRKHQGTNSQSDDIMILGIA
jgi:serine phosphatase RsbU (regulator of sigma subunit)